MGCQPRGRGIATGRESHGKTGGGERERRGPGRGPIAARAAWPARLACRGGAVLRSLVIAVTLGLAVTAGSADAACEGGDLFAEMAPEDQAAIRAAAAAVPFSHGNFWRATRAGDELILVGTYHFDDPRHEATLTALAPFIRAAGVLMVEAGPSEEAALARAVGEDPGLVVINDGPSLLERLPEDTWARLAAALAARGVPGFVAARFRPWYAAMLLALTPCEMASGGADNGLDRRLIRLAEEEGILVRALEPWNTLFTIFGDMDADEELAMIESSLAMEERADDYAATIREMYFDGDSRLIFEMTRVLARDLAGDAPEEADAGMDVMEEMLMNRRNRAWLPLLEEEAAGGRVVAAFGALHLAGREGVLALLSRRGWRVVPLDF